MTKQEVASAIAAKTGVDKQDSLKCLEAFMEVVKESLTEGNNVYLRGFGSFILKRRRQKTARNISQRTTLIIPEHYIPAFKPSKSFSNAVARFEK